MIQDVAKGAHMAIVKKFSIGVTPVSKMFRVHGLGGAAVDAVVRLRTKALSGEAFTDVGMNAERTAYQLTTPGKTSTFEVKEDSIIFSKDYYESQSSFDFGKVLDEFRVLWTALNSVLEIQDIRRVGMVAEHRFQPSTEGSSSNWLRGNLTTLDSKMVSDKFLLQFEEREYARDGIAPDPKKSDFINYIYHFYDSEIDASHPLEGSINANLDVQRYFAPVHNGNVSDEILKLHKHFESAQKRLDAKMKSLGAIYGKK
jgi:hypothetical protein